MVEFRKPRVDSANMCIESNGSRPVFPSLKFRLREERKRVIRISKAKYNKIEDHEIGMRRFCLIRNTLQCLKREAREEKLARHNAKANNVSPSYLSASRPPSPITALSDDEDEQPPCKRPRLFLIEDKENQIRNSCEDRLVDFVENKGESHTMDDTHEILREAYENYSGEYSPQSQPSSQSLQNQPDTSHSMLFSSTTNLYSNNVSSINCNNSEYSRLPGCMDWERPCSQSAFQGNDLKSVVYQSLITSL